MKRISVAVLSLLAIGLSTGCSGGKAGEPDKAASQQPSSKPESASAPQAAALTTAPVAVATTKSSVDSHEGKEFDGWECKNLDTLKDGRTASVELFGPVMEHRRESMLVTVWLHDPEEMGWRDAFYRSRYTGGPEKGKLMEDYWESHFTNGAEEATLHLTKGEELCPRCPADYEGWKFHLHAKVPRQDDATQLDEFFMVGTCNEKWLKSTEKSSPVVQPKDEARQ